jgi:hypothetical protein
VSFGQMVLQKFSLPVSVFLPAVEVLECSDLRIRKAQKASPIGFCLPTSSPFTRTCGGKEPNTPIFAEHEVSYESAVRTTRRG